jgi:hypothetical protein
MARRIAFCFYITTITTVLLLAAGAAQASPCSPGQEDWTWGKGQTAIHRLPAVRGVVYDPLSNSFAFVTPCGSARDDANQNQDFLDRNRLALPTQKLVLLIMPYNALDLPISLIVKDGKGVETEEISFKVDGGAKTDTGGAGQQPSVAKKQRQPEPKEPKAQLPPQPSPPPAKDKKAATKPADAAAVNEKIDSKLSPEASPDTYGQEAITITQSYGWSPEYHQYLEKIVERGSRNAKAQRDAAKADLLVLDNDSNTVKQQVKNIGVIASKHLSDTKLVLARDVSIDTIVEVARQRTAILAAGGNDYQSPISSKNTLSGRLALLADLHDLQTRANEVAAILEKAESILDELEPSLDRLDQVSSPRAASLRARVDGLRAQIQPLRDDLDHLTTKLDGFLPTFDDEVQSLNSPASQLQRFNFPPLNNSESKAFTVQRGPAKKGDPENVPAKANTLVLKSAPALTIRLGTGVVADALRDPTFKAVGDPSGSGKVIAYDDRGNGQVLPALFVHHYWGRRSGLLRPTTFERWVPTLSLGIPLTKAQILQEFLVGFDLELIPGLELNFGSSWGKVNALANGFHVGMPLPSSLDVTTVQEKRFRGGYYGGIVLNADVFKSLFDAQQKQQ